MNFKKQMEISAFMCTQWNILNSRINTKKESIKKPENANMLALRRAETEFDKQESSFKEFLFNFFKRSIFLIILPCIPVAIALFLYYYLHIEDQNILKTCFGSAFVIFILDLILINIFNKRKKEKKITKLKNIYLKQFEQKNKKIIKENQLLQKEVQELQKRKKLLEEKMHKECLIHPDYWSVGSQLYYLIDCGRAENLKEAINLFEHIKEEEARKVREEALAAEIRWNSIVAEQQHEEMMSEIKSHNDMMELAVFAAYINSK